MPSAEFVSYVAEIEAKQNAAATGPMLGYPMNNHELEALQDLHKILGRGFQANNCGDPLGHTDKPWRTHTLEQEGELLRNLMAPWGGNDKNCWGYITTGGTEGCTKGIASGFERLKARGFRKILICYSEASHYSVPKGASYCAASSEASIAVGADNAILLSKLKELLAAAKIMAVDAVLVNVCLGTTFFGGMDDLYGVNRALAEAGFLRQKNAYVHVDAALHGGFWHDHPTLPKYCVGKDFDSLSVSGHKWWGGFVAGCVFISKEGEVECGDGKAVEYVGMVDKFVSGSRSGSSPVLWMARILQFNWKEELERCLANVSFLTTELRELGIVHASQTINVLIQRPSEVCAKKWQLMCVGDEAQILLLPHVRRSHLEELLADLKQEQAMGSLRQPSSRFGELSSRRISYAA